MSIVLVGSTSGSITLQEPAVAGTTVLDLPATSGTILTTGSSGQVIPKAALPTGSVLQVVNATYSTTVSTSDSGNYIDTGVTATITPTASSSKILVLVNFGQCLKGTGDSGNSFGFRLLRDATVIRGDGSLGVFFTNSTLQLNAGYAFNYYDSPSSTSALVYKVQLINKNGNASISVQASSVPSTITLLEIAA
jgi:hypothetical protein